VTGSATKPYQEVRGLDVRVRIRTLTGEGLIQPPATTPTPGGEWGADRRRSNNHGGGANKSRGLLKTSKMVGQKPRFAKFASTKCVALSRHVGVRRR
jgi:hypothetical protein